MATSERQSVSVFGTRWDSELKILILILLDRPHFSSFNEEKQIQARSPAVIPTVPGLLLF